MKSRIFAGVVVVVGLLLAGGIFRAVERPLRRVDGRADRSASDETLDVLGGFRAFAADLAWLRAYASWEKREPTATEALIELTTTLDPRPVYFWLNGARMMAYDLPGWRIAAAGGFEVVPAAAQQRIEAEQARRALRFLVAARAFHPTSAALWIEQANIELNRLHDVAAAAASYRRAAEQPDAPYYAARIHAELLRRLGRKREALDWLVKLSPSLPPGDDAAAPELVRSRIRDLKRELGDGESGAERNLRGAERDEETKK